MKNQSAFYLDEKSHSNSTHFMSIKFHSTSLILLLLTSLFISSDSYSQFSSAGVGETASSVQPGVTQNTGNDIIDYAGNHYEVSVWDDVGGSSPGISWSVFYSSTPYTGNLTFSNTSNLIDPDVCLIVDAGNSKVHAVAVYFDNGNFDMESFTWSGSAFVSNGVTNIAAGTFNTTVNIDGDCLGAFGIIYDVPGGDIWAADGIATGGASPAITNFKRVLTGNYYSPDISIYADIVGTHWCHFTCLDNNNKLYVYDDRFPLGTTPTMNTFYSTPNNGVFAYPRIASPDSVNNLGGIPNDWMVVVGEYVAGPPVHYNILGYNLSGSTYTTTTYNNGSGNSPSDLRTYLNKTPVVTYDKGNGKVWVGWIMDNSSGNISGATAQAIYPIVLPCNSNGTIPGSSSYWDVPTSTTLTTNNTITALSISGRYSRIVPDNLYTFYETSTPDIWTKTVAQTGTSSLRVGQEVHSKLSNNIITNRQKLREFGEMKLRLYDYTGHLIIEENGDFGQLEGTLRSQSSRLAEGLYILQFASTDGSLLAVQKLFLPLF